MQVFTEKAPTCMLDRIVMSSPHALSVSTANGTVTADRTTAYIGDTVTLAVMPNVGYVLSEIKANGKTVVADVTGKYSFAMPDADCEITAVFVPKAVLPSYSMTVATVEHGVVTTDRTTAKAGDTVTLTVTPSQGYRAVWVKVNGASIVPTDGEYGFVMPSCDCNITARFELSDLKIRRTIRTLR